MPTLPRHLAVALAVLGATAAFAQIMDPQQRAGRVAILNGDVEGLRQALAAGWDPNAPQEGGRPSWWQVIPFEFFVALPALFEGGADPEVRSQAGFTALHYAVGLERPAAITALIEAGMDPDARGLLSAEDRGELARTALHHAAFTGCEPCARALVAGGADANALDVGNATPLWAAREEGHADVVAFLEGLGATDDPNEAAGNPLRRPGAPPPVGGREPGVASGGGGDCETQLDLSALTGEGGFGEGDCEEDPGRTSQGGNRPGGESEGRDGAGNGDGGEAGGPAPPPAPRAARPVYEVNVANVLGGPLAGLWGAFQGRHPDWGLDGNGHITRLEGGTTMTGGTRIDALPGEWAQELHQIGVEQGLVAGNPSAPYLVAPRGGLAAVMAQESAQIRAEQAAQAEQPGLAAGADTLGVGEETAATAEGRPSGP